MEKLTKTQIRKILGDKRFNMSGYDNWHGKNANRGGCVMHNTDVLNTFAEWGIYEYTDFLYLDFYKGNPTLYFKYFYEPGIHVIDDMAGYTTSEIILKVLEVTIYSNKNKRRVNE